MDGFGQVSSESGLFSSESVEYAPDSADLSNDAEDINPSADAGMAWTPGEADDPQEDWQDSSADSGMYTMGEATAFIPGEALADDEDDAGFCEMEEGLSVGEDELSSYDLGHYDDPDEPAAAFVLDEEIEATEPDVDPCLSQSAMYYTEEIIPEAPAPLESVMDDPPEEPARPETMPLVQPMQPVQQLQQATPQPQPMAEPVPKASAEPPKPLPAVARKAEEPIPPKLPTRHTYYNDSVTEALNTFEQEVLLRDSHFLKQSINNLVERYFSQNEPETEW
jgi:hypothetical protein